MAKKNFERQVHTWVMKGTKEPQYIRRRKKEEKGIGPKKRKKIIRACLKRLMAKKLRSQLQSLYTKIQYLSPRFRLAFSPALYKFIVCVTWTQIHPYSGSKSNLVLTIGAVCGKLLDLIRKRFGFSAQDGGIRFTSTDGRATSRQR